jgi:putative ABC transport system permease protein
VGMISKEFLVMIAISCAIALPIGYYFASQWLQGFIYRIELGLEVGVVAVLVATLIAAATIVVKTFVAALANPVESLRND